MLGCPEEVEGVQQASVAWQAMDLDLQWHSIRVLHYLRWKDLVPMGASLWAHLKAVSEDHSALQVMGITWEAFDHLHGFFRPVLLELWQ